MRNHPHSSQRSATPETSSFDSLYIRRAHWFLPIILLVYAGVAAIFAAFIPPWQAPDEPAHYNYIRDIAETGSLPVLQMGDYDQETLETLKQTRFYRQSIDSVRYESYQPPLYYMSAAPIFRLSGGHLLILRLYNVLLGGIALYLLYRSLELVFANKPLIVLTATAFAAFLPMHVAVNASLTNDVLAEVMVNAAIYMLLVWLRSRYNEDNPNLTPAEKEQIAKSGGSWEPRQERRYLRWLGIVLGLGLLTKSYLYVVAPIVVLTIIGVYWRQWVALGRGWRGIGQGIKQALWVALPAFVLGLPFWLRNVSLYGRGDFLGLQWHDVVVTGQPRAAEWIAEHGWVEYSERAFSFTFRSFWGVFGWMGVFMDERIYTACLLFSGILFLGLLWAVVRLISGRPDTDMTRFQMAVLTLFAIFALAVVGSYVWYNSKFVQHQGRYFFWGLLPLSTFVALAWREILQPLQGVITGALGLVLAVSLALAGWVGGELDKWTILLTVLCSGLVLVQPLFLANVLRRPSQPAGSFMNNLLASNVIGYIFKGLRLLVWAAPFLLLVLLNALIPFLFILPQLAGSE